MSEDTKTIIGYAVVAGVFLLLLKKLFGVFSGIGKESKEEKAISGNVNLKSSTIAETMKPPKHGKRETKLFPQSFVKQNAKDIYNALGDFTIDNDEKVIGIFEQYRYQTQAQQLSEMFYKLYKTSLRAFLAKYLSNNSLRQINEMISQLPKGQEAI